MELSYRGQLMASRNASFHESVFMRSLLMPVTVLVSLTVVLAILLLAAWIVFWSLEAFVWCDGGTHLRTTLATEYQTGIELAARQGSGPTAISGPANALYWLVFEATGIQEMAQRFADPSPLSIPDTVARSQYIAIHRFMEIAMAATQLLGVRLATAVRYIPLVGLLYYVAAVDGLVQRTIRIARGGAESSSLYHRAKHFQVTAAMLGFGLLAVWPNPIEWRLSVLGVFGLACIAACQARLYKKYP